MKKLSVLVSIFVFFCLINTADSQYSKIGLAIFPFKGADKQTEEKIISELNGELYKSKFIRVLDRSNVDTMMKEASLGMTGAINPATVVEVGKIHGMQVMISGSYNKNRIVANATHMETLKVISSATVNSIGEIEELGKKLKAGIESYVIGETLKKLRNETPEISLDFWVQKKGSSEKIIPGKKGRVKIGDSVEFHFKSDKDGYITILDIQPGGDLVILFPNDSESSNKITAGMEYVIPSAESGFETIVSEPAGLDKLLVFFTTKKWDLLDPKILTGEGFKSVKEDKKEEMSRGFTNISTLKKNQWVGKSIEIEVVK